MTKPHDLDELAARVEAATGPSRHLDTQIFILLDPDAEHIVGRKPGPFPQEAIYGPRSSFWDWACDETKEPPQFASIPAYTASLDAAMTLVPVGWEVTIWSTGYVEIYKLGEIVTFEDGTKIRPYACAGSPITVGPTATPALALVAAALRALTRSLGGG